MKTRLLTAVALVFVVVTALAQTPEQSITNKIKSMYPGATIQNIRPTDNGGYTIVFITDKQKGVCLFTSTGQWLKTNQTIKTTDLPGDVKQGYKDSPYKGWYVEACNRIQTPKGVYYSIDIESPYTFTGSAKTDNYIYFTPQGSLVNK